MAIAPVLSGRTSIVIGAGSTTARSALISSQSKEQPSSEPNRAVDEDLTAVTEKLKRLKVRLACSSLLPGCDSLGKPRPQPHRTSAHLESIGNAGAKKLVRRIVDRPCRDGRREAWRQRLPAIDAFGRAGV